MKAIPVIAICAAVLALVCGVAAASPPESAISRLPDGDRTFFYMKITDVEKITSRLQKSEGLRYLGTWAGLPPRAFTSRYIVTPREIALMLRDDPNEDAVICFQMAWRMGEDNLETLRKIAKKTATPEDIADLDGLEMLGPALRVIQPDPGEPNDFYRIRMRPFNLYISAHDDLLIFGNTPEALRASLKTASRGAWSFAPKTEGDGRNFICAGAEEDLTALLRQLILREFELASVIEPAGAYPKRMSFEGDIKLAPGGWSLDFYSNIVQAVFGEELTKNMKMPDEPFYSAGGGKLLGMFDASPIMKAVTANISAMAKVFLDLDEDISSLPIARALDNIDRIQSAITRGGGDPADMRFYVYLSSQKDGVGASLGAEVEKYLGTLSSEVTKFDAGEGKRGYTIQTPEPLASSMPSSLGHFSVVLGDKGVLLAWMPQSLVATPFSSDSALYAKLADDKPEMGRFYLDVRNLRKSFAAIMGEGKSLNSPAGKLWRMMLPLMDFHEISAETFSMNHVRYNFRTGWFDLYDREILRQLFGLYR